MKHKPSGFNSKLVHGAGPKDPLGSVITPIYQTSTFAFESATWRLPVSQVKAMDSSTPGSEIRPSVI